MLHLMRVGVVLVHGVGAQGPRWAEGIIPRLHGAVLAETARIAAEELRR